jgi:hypothetical protein
MYCNRIIRKGAVLWAAASLAASTPAFLNMCVAPAGSQRQGCADFETRQERPSFGARIDPDTQILLDAQCAGTSYTIPTLGKIAIALLTRPSSVGRSRALSVPVQALSASSVSQSSQDADHYAEAPAAAGC